MGLTVDAGDVELALRYVPDYRVLVLAADLDAEVLRAVVDATAWSGAHLIALVADDGMAAMLPSDATVLARPGTDPDDEFAAMVAAYAVALDEGSAPGDAFATAKSGRRLGRGRRLTRQRQVPITSSKRPGCTRSAAESS